jgi:RNA polymerase sigma-70 factor (ECF subfamily)
MRKGAGPAATANSQPPPVDLATLIADHHAVVYRYACRLCGCPTEAEDLTQQTFLIAQQKLGQLREGGSARGWLLSIVRSCFLKSIRKARPLTSTAADFDLEHVPDAKAAVSAIDQEELAQALAELPDEFRLVLLMFYFENLSYQSIAQELDVPIGTVMSRLSRGKSHLRRRLAEPPVAARSPHRPTADSYLRRPIGSSTVP